MKFAHTFTTFFILMAGYCASVTALGADLTKEQMRLSELDLQIIQLENNLADLIKNKRNPSEQARLSQEIKILKRDKVTKDRIAKYHEEMGSLNTALSSNRDVLSQLEDELQKIKAVLSKGESDKTDDFLKRIKKQKDDIERQQNKLKGVLSALEKKIESVHLKVIGAHRGM